MNPGWTFIDATVRALRSPDTFEVPSVADLQKVKPGWYVKIGIELDDIPEDERLSGERFWIEVLDVNINEDIITGRVDNDLIVGGHGVAYNDLITFGFSNILDILPPKEAIEDAL